MKKNLPLIVLGLCLVYWGVLAAVNVMAETATLQGKGGKLTYKGGKLAGVVRPTTTTIPGWNDENGGYLACRLLMDPTATNAQGKVNDSSGNGNHGVLDPLGGNPTWTETDSNAVMGRAEHAYRVTTTNSNLPKIAITVPDSVSLYSSTNYAAALWFWNDGTWSANPLGMYAGHTWNNSGTWMDVQWLMYKANSAGTSNKVAIGEQGGADFWQTVTLAPLSTGAWVHVALHFGDPSAPGYAGLRVWTNGVYAGNSAVAGTASNVLKNSTHNLCLGYTVRFNPGFGGYYDDLRIYTNIPASLWTDGYVSNLCQKTQKPNGSIEIYPP